MKKKYSIILAFLSLVILVLPVNTNAQRERLITVESVVKNTNGEPLENVNVYSGNSYVKTDASGRFSIEVESGNKLVFEGEGYEDITITTDEARNRNEIQLNAVDFLYGTDDDIQLAFRKAKRGNLVGSVSVVNTADIESYDNNIWSNDILNGRTLGLMGSNSIRGIGIGIDVASLTGSGTYSGNALFIVDG